LKLAPSAANSLISPTVLRFLADESCDFAVMRALRAAGYDALAVSKVTRRSDDSELIAQAAREQCILFTLARLWL